MNLLRLYLNFYNSGQAWTVYAARNQNLSIPIDSSTLPTTPMDASSGTSAGRDGHSPFFEWLDRNY